MVVSFTPLRPSMFTGQTHNQVTRVFIFLMTFFIYDSLKFLSMPANITPASRGYENLWPCSHMLYEWMLFPTQIHHLDECDELAIASSLFPNKTSLPVSDLDISAHGSGVRLPMQTEGRNDHCT